MRKDDIKAQMKRNELEKELKSLQKTVKELIGKSYELKEYEELSSSGLKEAQEEVQELSTYRKAALVKMNKTIEDKTVLEKKKQVRKEKSDMIKEMAAGDLEDADFIRIKKFLTVQMFVKALLKEKMDKIKTLYEPF